MVTFPLADPLDCRARDVGCCRNYQSARSASQSDQPTELMWTWIPAKARLAYANPHAQLVFRTMMEEWHRKGHPVDPTENGISLRAKVGEKNYALVYLAPALARHPGTIILAWRALQGTRCSLPRRSRPSGLPSQPRPA